MIVEGDAGFRSHCPGLLERIQAELTARPDIDSCARVALRLEDDARIGVLVTLPDGRVASRSVARHDDVIPTLQALLLVPEPAPTAPTARTAKRPKARPAPRRSPRLATTPALDRAESPVDQEARDLGFELSAITGARVGDGQFGFGAGVLSFVELYGWLVGFEGRLDGYRAMAGGDADTALELGLLAGRRFDLDGVTLDLTAGPAVAMRGLALSQTESVRVDDTTSMPPPTPPAPPDETPAPRLLLGARVGFSPRSLFRTFVGIDGEFGPGRRNSDPASGSLPRFCVGLALGATLGTP